MRIESLLIALPTLSVVTRFERCQFDVSPSTSGTSRFMISDGPRPGWGDGLCGKGSGCRSGNSNAADPGVAPIRLLDPSSGSAANHDLDIIEAGIAKPG